MIYDNDVAHFLTATRIDQEDSKIYCEDGYYDIKNESGEFRENAQYIQGEKTALGELISYDAEQKKVTLAGEARYTEEDKVAIADTIVYFEEQKTRN